MGIREGIAKFVIACLNAYHLPESLAPPNGCCPTTDPVDLSLM